MNVDEQRKYIRNKLTELREFVAGTNIPVGKEQFERLHELLMDSMCSVRMKPFNIQVTQNKIGVKWTLDAGYVSVLFGPEENWEWEACTVERDFSGDRNDGSDPTFEVSYRHSGACSFKLHDAPYYYLPDEVEELVSEPDTFEGTYEPKLKPYQYNIVWVTNKYDGMLSGYAMVNDRLCYCDTIEETEFKSHRMFAVFELSLWERFNVWRRYHTWNTAMTNRTFWKVYWWWRNVTRRPRKTPEDHWADIRTWRQAHTIVGYFEG